tara:strand:+ start:672 stop:824 length:153 start_codon:yes stop_codon:yes gene_type:complete
MKSLLAIKRSKAIFAIVILAISIGAISKKLTSFPAERCIKEVQELTLKRK